MSRRPDGLPSDANLPPALRTKVDTYVDQGGLLGALTHFFTVLDTDDADLAATLASIPTNLFVTSALHDDAIDKADEWGADRKRRLNEHVSVGDLIFTNVAETVATAPDAVDLTPALETARKIGTGQLAEETFDGSNATVDDAIARIEARGSVWGELAVRIVAATGGYSDAQLEALRTIATNSLFVLTVIDDLADLPEDIENDVTTLPLVYFDGDPDEYGSTEAVIDAVLTSDVPDRLAELITRRQAAIEAAAADLRVSLDLPNEALLEAGDRTLAWYCESISSDSVGETVPVAQQRAIRERVTGDEQTRRRYVAECLTELPIAADADEAVAAVSDVPGELLAETAIRFHHLGSIADGVMYTSLEDALAELRTASARTP
ncbi:hypothetical protein [Natrinema halophilum]|uniref:Geranylgeranyl pyrophosphate synthase n=1 Tax=Natrinema halophilum TaxID=1699371 RepID=A0A7D5KMW4_9EURY|nr:hypothetical protein [Natrinema halophilum]QLG51098.1 hypothetical protein HYG82_20820 [Natrinema halophilum]